MAYRFLGQICVETNVILSDVHVPLKQNTLEKPAGIF